MGFRKKCHPARLICSARLFDSLEYVGYWISKNCVSWSVTIELLELAVPRGLNSQSLKFENCCCCCSSGGVFAQFKQTRYIIKLHEENLIVDDETHLAINDETYTRTKYETSRRITE